MVYGLPYKGSKNTIANKIIFSLPNAEVFIDLFGGGGAITHAAMLSCKFDKVIYNELSPITFQYFKRSIDGDLPDKKHFVSREEFHEKKNSDPFVKYVWSFANNGRDYIYGKDIEQEKRLAYEKYITTNKRIQSIQSIQSIERIERIGLKDLQFPKLELQNKSYEKVDIPDNAIVYCDIPYKGTNKYDFDFDYDKFYYFACSVKVPIFISEYQMPSDRFKVYREFEKRCCMSAQNNSLKKIERVFVPK